MAEVIGFLREDATYGEKQTLRLLSRNLPKEFTVYVESPIHKKRDISLRFPYRDKPIAILVRYTRTIRQIPDRLRRLDVRVQPIHGFKGLEADVVFLPHLQQTFLKEDEEDIAAERRILYMAMSRAREKLYMTYFGKLPRPYEVPRRQSLADFVG